MKRTAVLSLASLLLECGGEEEGILVVSREAREAGVTVVVEGGADGDATPETRVLPYAVPATRAVVLRADGREARVAVEPGAVVLVGADLGAEEARGDALLVEGDADAVRRLAAVIDAAVEPLGPGRFRLTGEASPSLVERAAYADDVAGIRDLRPVAAPQTPRPAAPRPVGRPAPAAPAPRVVRLDGDAARLGAPLSLRLPGVADGTRVVVRLVDADGRRQGDVARFDAAVAGGAVAIPRLEVAAAFAPERVRVVAEAGGARVESEPIVVRRRAAQYYSSCGSRLPATDRGFEARFWDGSIVEGRTDDLGLAVVADAPAGEYEMIFQNGVPLPRPYAFDADSPETWAHVGSALRARDLDARLYAIHDASELGRPEWANDLIQSLADPHPGVWISAAMALGSYPPGVLDRAGRGFPYPARWNPILRAAGRRSPPEATVLGALDPFGR